MKIKLNELDRLIKSELRRSTNLRQLKEIANVRSITKNPKGSKNSHTLDADFEATDISELDPNDPDFKEKVRAFYAGESVGWNDSIDAHYYPDKTGHKTLRPKFNPEDIPAGFRMGQETAGYKSPRGLKADIGKKSRRALEPWEDKLRDAAQDPNVTADNSLARKRVIPKLRKFNDAIAKLNEAEALAMENGNVDLANMIEEAIAMLQQIQYAFRKL